MITTHVSQYKVMVPIENMRTSETNFGTRTCRTCGKLVSDDDDGNHLAFSLKLQVSLSDY